MRCLEWARDPSTPTLDTRAESEAEVSGARAETRKAVKRSIRGIQVWSFFWSTGAATPNMSNAKGDDSGETIYLNNSMGKDNNGDGSAGETNHLANNGKGPNLDDHRPAAGGGAEGTNTGDSSVAISEGGSSVADLGGPATASTAPAPAWVAVLGNFQGQLISIKLGQALEGRIPATLP